MAEILLIERSFSTAELSGFLFLFRRTCYHLVLGHGTVHRAMPTRFLGVMFSLVLDPLKWGGCETLCASPT